MSFKIKSNGLQYNVDTIEDLPTTDLEENQVCVVTEDGRGGTFVYKVANAAIDNGGTIFNGWTRQYDGSVNIKWFGANGDGITDDTVAIQSALNLSKHCYLPAGKYRVTSELVFKDGSGLSGDGVPYGWYPSVPDQEWDSTKNTWLHYDGIAGENICVCRFSDYSVGVEPVGTQLTSQTIEFQDIGIDGNNKAGIGAYYVRPRGNFTRYTVRGTTHHAHLFMIAAAVTMNDVGAFRNYGKGFTLGDNIYGWSNLFVDEMVLNRPIAAFNGLNSQWDNTANIDKGYGFGFYNCRGLTVIGIESSRNDGAGVYYANEKPNVIMLGGYTEFNTDGHLESYGVIVNGSIGGFNIEFKNINIRDSVRLTGDEPSRESAPLIFDACSFISNINSDWDNYKLINCGGLVPIENVAPVNKGNSFNNFDTFKCIGIGTVNIGTGAISGDIAKGVINSYSYIGTGDVRVNLTGLTDENYIIQVIGQSNRITGILGKTSSNFRIQCHTSSGSLIDGGAEFEIAIYKA